VLIIVRSQYRYWAMSKIFQPSEVPTKIYILSWAHISFEINMSLREATRSPQFGNLWYTLCLYWTTCRTVAHADEGGQFCYHLKGCRYQDSSAVTWAAAGIRTVLLSSERLPALQDSSDITGTAASIGRQFWYHLNGCQYECKCRRCAHGLGAWSG
jgi:hypothetical protein